MITMRNRLTAAAMTVGLVVALAPWAIAQETPGPVQTSGPGRGKKRAPASAAPRNKDGRISLGPGPGQTGFWGGGGSIVGHGGSSLPTNLLIDQVPFQPWAAA